jgi:CDGSH-type Zn-finger protein
MEQPQPNGPPRVSGRVRILDANGVAIREDTRVALCRCGHSRNQPFCDGGHEIVGFQAEGRRGRLRAYGRQ